MSAWIRLLPIVFFLSYLSATVILFAFGPWPWPVGDATTLYAFLVLAHLALLLGYLSAAFTEPAGYYGKWRIETLIVTSLAVNLLVLFPTSFSRTGSFIPRIWAGIANPGKVYFESILQRAASTNPIEYARILLGPLLFLLLPLVIFFWQRLRLAVRWLSAFSILGFVAIYVATGTNKGLADVLLIIPWLIMASHRSGNFKLSRTLKLALITSVVAAVLLFTWFFTSGQISRKSSSTQARYSPFANIRVDADNFLIRGLPPVMKSGVIGLTSYLTQGYYALHLSLEKPFIPMFGMGHSMFLYRNAAKLTGLARIERMPYPRRIEEDGWDAYTCWSSIYPWLASDLSFLGTILAVFLIGRLFALAWLDSLRGSNPFAIAMLAQFLIMLFYFPANNQVMQTGEGLISFYFILFLWLFTRRKPFWERTGM